MYEACNEKETVKFLMTTESIGSVKWVRNKILYSEVCDDKWGLSVLHITELITEISIHSMQHQPYPMVLPKLGHAVLLNNLATDLPDTVADVEALRSTLETIGFKVKIEKDLNFQVTC